MIVSWLIDWVCLKCHGIDNLIDWLLAWLVPSIKINSKLWIDWLIEWLGTFCLIDRLMCSTRARGDTGFALVFCSWWINYLVTHFIDRDRLLIWKKFFRSIIFQSVSAAFEFSLTRCADVIVRGVITVFAEIRAYQKQWFFQGGSTHNRWLLMGDFSKGGVHKTDGFWWVLEFVSLLLKIRRSGRLFGQIRYILISGIPVTSFSNASQYNSTYSQIFSHNADLYQLEAYRRDGALKERLVFRLDSGRNLAQHAAAQSATNSWQIYFSEKVPDELTAEVDLPPHHDTSGTRRLRLTWKVEEPNLLTKVHL